MPAHGQRDRSIFESREHPRVRITTPIVCSFSRGRMRRWLPRMGHDGIILDMSLKGARILSDTAILPGDRLTLTIRLPYQIARMRVAVATVRWEKEQIYGIEFTRLSPVAETRLRMFLAAVGKRLVAPYAYTPFGPSTPLRSAWSGGVSTPAVVNEFRS